MYKQYNAVSYGAGEDVDYTNHLLERMRDNMERRKGDSKFGRNAGDALPSAIEVDMTEFYIIDNANKHHTSKYALVRGNEPSPVLRRGEHFLMAIRFKKDFSFATDRARLDLSFGPKNLIGKDVMVQLPVIENKEFTRDAMEWDVVLRRHDKAILSLDIRIPPTAGVGLWTLKINTKGTEETSSSTFECKENIYILFNPWCKDDAVYMSDEAWRQEYVLNDLDKSFRGMYNNFIGYPWIYGQFAEFSLQASMLMLQKSGLNYISRGNVVKVVRAISAMVCSNNNGVLQGKWYGTYDGGRDPSSWTGSVAILQQYFQSGGAPVKYGQCWVFAGVCTTVCRSLGIPCRSITNFSSAHDTNETLTLDTYLNAHGEHIKHLNKDDTWNFHCWNDCWMNRYDLPHSYGGWQGVDGTPQERSDGIFQSGPASLVAIRQGEVGYLYDTAFAYAKVNADVVVWQVDKTTEIGWRKVSTDISRIGKLIVTKKVGVYDQSGRSDIEDITNQYKSSEGTEEERMSIFNAARKYGAMAIFDMPTPDKEDVRMKMRKIDQVMIGQPFKVAVDIENMSDQIRTVQAIFSISSVFYTGVIARKVKKTLESYVLQPKQKNVVTLDVSERDYLEKLVEKSMMKVYTIMTVKETRQAWSDADDIRMIKPTLNVETEAGLGRSNMSFNLKISFTNPLNKVLSDCQLTIEGSGDCEPFVTELEDINENGTLNHTQPFEARQVGKQMIVVIFSSRELIEVVGSKLIDIKD